MNEIVDRTGRFDPRESAPGDNERQQPIPAVGDTIEIGFVELRDEMISQADRVVERLHRKGPLFDAGKSEEIRRRAKGQHELGHIPSRESEPISHA